MDSVALQSLLELARARNAALGITGMLLYSNGRILQVLEGESGPLDALYEKIASDPRHDHVRTVMTLSIKERDFSNWSMAYRALSQADVQAHPEWNDFFSPVSTKKVSANSHRQHGFCYWPFAILKANSPLLLVKTIGFYRAPSQTEAKVLRHQCVFTALAATSAVPAGAALSFRCQWRKSVPQRRRTLPGG